MTTAAAKELRVEGDRIAQVLDELRALGAPPIWRLVEELVQRMVRLEGAAVDRLLTLATQDHPERATVVARLCDDELVSSLLLLHDLHPRSIEQRVADALDEVRPYLRSHGGGVELVEIDEGRVRLSLIGSCQGCPSSQATITQAIEQSLFEHVPELVAVEVDDASARGPLPAPGRARWVELPGATAIAAGERACLEVEGHRLLVLRLGEHLLAYRDGCPYCQAAGLAIAGEVADCGCGARFDLARAGRPLDGKGAPLPPLPLLVDEIGARVALA